MVEVKGERTKEAEEAYPRKKIDRCSEAREGKMSERKRGGLKGK